MAKKIIKILVFISIYVMSYTMDQGSQHDSVMDELEMGVYENIEKVTQEYARIYVDKLVKRLKKDKITKQEKKDLIDNVQKQLLSMAKKKTVSKKKANRFKQFESFATAIRKRKRSTDSEKLSDEEFSQNEEKKLIALMHILHQDSLDKVTQLKDKKILLKQQTTELQEDINQKTQTIGEKAKAIKKRTIAGIGGTVVAFLSGGGMSAISDLIIKFSSNNNCQMKTNCQSLMAQNKSLTELETFCAGVISSCK